MKTARISLGQLLARITGSEDPDTGKASADASKTDAADKGKGKEKEDDEEEDSDDEEKEDDDTADKKKKKKDGKTSEEKTAENAEKGASDVQATVTMAMSDFQALESYALEAESLRDENKSLKAKADQWDAYQAAIGGTKSSSDSAGAKDSDAGESNSKDPHADLRKKYGKLMDGI